MKQLALISLFLILVISMNGQVSDYPPKVIAITIGEKHPSFDDSKFANIDFYYIIKEKYKNPEGMLENIDEGDNLLFDKNGVFIIALGYYPTKSTIGEAYHIAVRKKVVTDDELFDYTYLDDLTKKYIKKDKTEKENKKVKSKHPEELSKDYNSAKLPDFKVTDANGKEYSFNSVVTGEPLTLVVFMYFDLWNTSFNETERGYIEKLKKLNSGI